MDTKKRRSGGFGSIFFMIIIIGIIWAVIAQMSQRTSNYKYKNFVSDLKDNKITNVVISQNAEVPTGTLTITFTDGSKDTLNFFLFFHRKFGEIVIQFDNCHRFDEKGGTGGTPIVDHSLKCGFVFLFYRQTISSISHRDDIVAQHIS